jgi:hypothetical protein
LLGVIVEAEFLQIDTSKKRDPSFRTPEELELGRQRRIKRERLEQSMHAALEESSVGCKGSAGAFASSEETCL